MSKVKARLNFYKSKAGADWRKLASVKHYQTLSPAKGGQERGGNPWNGSKRWVNVEALGLRDYGNADQICGHIRHRGWFLDHFEDETARGQVWQLPAKNGQPRFVYGFADCYNAGLAFIDFCHTFCERSAANNADDMAKEYAEGCREFYAKDAAERDIGDAKADIHALNGEALALIKEIKQAGAFSPNICAALKSHLTGILRRRSGHFAVIKARQDDFWSAVGN